MRHGVFTFSRASRYRLIGTHNIRARLHWSAGSDSIPSLRAGALGWYLLLVAAGTEIGMLVSAGSVLLVGMVGSLSYLLPWTKIPACRTQFVVSSVSMLTGAVAWIVMVDNPVQSFYFRIAACMLYLCAMFLYLFVLLSLNHDYRISPPRLTDKTDSDVHMPIPNN